MHSRIVSEEDDAPVHYKCEPCSRWDAYQFHVHEWQQVDARTVNPGCSGRDSARSCWEQRQGSVEDKGKVAVFERTAHAYKGGLAGAWSRIEIAGGKLSRFRMPQVHLLRPRSAVT